MPKLALATLVVGVWTGACDSGDKQEVDCSNVGCALAICSEACTAPCGCCDCLPGTTTQRNGKTLTCRNGCFAESDSDAGSHTIPDGSNTQNDACPASAPAPASACNGDISCTYLDCTGDGMTNAVCSNAQWMVTTAPCASTPCGVSANCDPGMVCVEHISGAFIAECVANPCGTGPITCECAGSLCGSGQCNASGTTISCNNCPSGLCP